MAFSVADALNCVQLNKLGTIMPPQLHQGNYGKVYAICDIKETDRKSCSKVVKIVKVGTKVQDALLEREIDILRLLQPSRFVPILYGPPVICSGYAYIVLERFEQNMDQLGLAQAELRKGPLTSDLLKVPMSVTEANHFMKYAYFYTEDQMMQMFRIARRMGQDFKVIHGDLKPDQYLFRSPNRVVVTDFGFSGDDNKWPAVHGWNHINDCYARSPIPLNDLGWLYYFNLFQLWFWFAYRDQHLVFIEKPNGKLTLFPRYDYPFTKVNGIPQVWLNFVMDSYRRCSGGEAFFRQRWRLYDTHFPSLYIPNWTPPLVED